ACHGSHKARAPIILTSPPPIMPTAKAAANRAKTSRATATCIAMSGQKARPLTHQKGMASSAIARLRPLGILRDLRSHHDAASSIAASAASRIQESVAVIALTL